MSTAVDTVTGELVEVMDREQAEKVTRDIKAWAGTLWLKIEEAHRGRAWLALGYESWESYLDTEFDIGRSRGYQLVTHARAVRALAEAAGVDVSTIVDIPEGHTRGVDADAVASEVAEQVDETTTEVERATVVKTTLQKHAEFAKRAKAKTDAAPPATEPAPDGADEGDPEDMPGTPDPDQAGGDPPSAPLAGPDDAGGVGSDASPPASDLALYLINALKAESATRKGLLTFDPERLVLTSRDHGLWIDLVADLRKFADDLTAAVTAARPLRRVK